MKFVVLFKTPDTLDYAISNTISDLPEGESEQAELLEDTMRALAENYIQYGEEIRVEFDTTTQTVRVLPVKK